MTADLGPKVGLLDLDDSEATRCAGLAAAGYSEARFLVRVHGAPIGQVSIPVEPEESLAARARSAAEADLADTLRLHARWDRDFDERADGAEWTALVACPQRTAAKSGPGLSVIVCTRDRAAILRDCLVALQRISYDPIEFLVIDNAPTS